MTREATLGEFFVDCLVWAELLFSFISYFYMYLLDLYSEWFLLKFHLSMGKSKGMKIGKLNSNVVIICCIYMNYSK